MIPRRLSPNDCIAFCLEHMPGRLVRVYTLWLDSEYLELTFRDDHGDRMIRVRLEDDGKLLCSEVAKTIRDARVSPHKTPTDFL